MIIRNLDEVPTTPVDFAGAEGVTKQLVIGSGDGAPNFSFRVFTIEPGGHSPHHCHEVEHLNYVLSGTGALLDDQDQERPLAAGQFAFVSPGETHQFRNTGDTPFVFLCAVPNSYE